MPTTPEPKAKRPKPIDVLATTESSVYWIVGGKGHFTPDEALEHFKIWDCRSNVEIISCEHIYYRKGFLPHDVLEDLEESGPMNGWCEVHKSQSHRHGVMPATKVTIVYIFKTLPQL